MGKWSHTFVYKSLFIQGQDSTSSLLALALCDIPLRKGANICKGAVDCNPRACKDFHLFKISIFSHPLSHCFNSYSSTFTLYFSGQLGGDRLTFPPYAQPRLCTESSILGSSWSAGMRIFTSVREGLVVHPANYSRASFPVASFSPASTQQNLNFNVKVSGCIATFQDSWRLLHRQRRNALDGRDG